MIEEVVEAIIYNPKKGILLQKKTLDYKAFPGMWAFFGGHKEKNESKEKVLRREIKEETGCEIINFNLFMEREDILPLTKRPFKRHIYEIIVDWNTSDIKLDEGAGFAYFDPSEFSDIKINSPCLEVLEQWKKKRRY